MLILLGKVTGVLPPSPRLLWVEKFLQQFVFKDRLSEDREKVRERGRGREGERTIGIKVVFCILICEYVIRINEA